MILYSCRQIYLQAHMLAPVAILCMLTAGRGIVFSVVLFCLVQLILASNIIFCKTYRCVKT